MEDILKDIIEADKLAQNKVEAKKSEKYHLDEELKALEEQARKVSFDKMNHELDIQKQALDVEYQEVSAKVLKQLELDKQNLLNKYHEQKETWLLNLMNSIVKE